MQILRDLKLYLTTLLVFTIHIVAAQRFTVSGTVRLQSTGETVIGATIEELHHRQYGLTNTYGFYSIDLPAGPVTIVVSLSGTKADTLTFDLNSDIQKNFYLQNKADILDEVVVTMPPSTKTIRGTQMGAEQLSANEIKLIPQLLGERDPLKAIQLLPGIKAASEGSSGIYVRGGAADQNLILLDEAVVYNASHLLGFFSTFNSDVIKDVTVYKGSMPAQYGGRLSSVVDVRMNDGNNQKLAVSGGIGLISSKLNIEGPLQKGVSSFLVSGRSTYIDPFLKLSKDSTVNRNKIGFYDLNTKINYQLGERDRIFLSGYFGNDHLAAGKEIALRWGNSTGTLRWNHLYKNGAFSNTSFIYSNFDYSINIRFDANNLNIFSRIRDGHLKQEWQWYKARHSVRAGFDIIHHTINPGDITTSDQSNFNDVQFEKRYSFENAVFVSDEWKLSTAFAVNYGLRIESFSILGKGNFFDLDASGNITDTIYVPSGHILKTYFNPEPRLSMRLMLNTQSSLKASYVRNTQNLHLLSNSTTSRPTDRWVSSTNNIKPETADQVSLGYYHNFRGSAYRLSVETYYKDMFHQIDYRDGADLDKEKNLESQLLYGIGRAYGVEFYLGKRTGKLTGWLSYTLSKSEKKIDGINGDQWYNARQDRTHDIALVGNLQLTNEWSLSATWVYYTGDAVSFPEAKYTVNNSIYYYYSKRNGYRMPDYHRLDLGATKTFKKKKFTSELTFGVYNAYGRENAYTINFQTSDVNPEMTEIVQTSLFRFVPSISYNFKF